jgi:hypothetical protein
VLKGWVAGKVDEYHGMRVLSRIDTASPRNHIRDQLAAYVTRTAAENSDWPWKARRHAIFLVGRFGGRTTEDATALDWLGRADQEGQGDRDPPRGGLFGAEFPPLTQKQVEVVEEYVEEEKDKEVADALRAAVNKAKQKK